MTIPHHMYIDGQWCEADEGNRRDIVDPSTEAVVDSVPVATDADIDRALSAADRGWGQWREVDAWSRSKVLRKTADLLRERIVEMAAVLTEEQGKPLAESVGELNAMVDQFDWYADESRRIYGRIVEGHSREHRLLVMRQPIGPVAAFTPWNFPALLSARKIAVAIAAGCSIIITPAMEAPRTTLMIAQACEDAELAPGVLNVLTGDPAHISRRLISSGVIRKVSLTGSVPVGRLILKLCAEHIIPATMELGGHSPVLVFEDADPEHVAQITAMGKFRNMGQVCISASRFYVHESIAKTFTDKFVDVAKNLKIGPGCEPDTDIGPMANQRRVDAIDELIADATAKGALLQCGGKRPDGYEKGFYYEPTVLSNVNETMSLMRDEPFGPIAPIVPVANLDDALEKANNTEFGLAAYVFTNNTRNALLAAERLDVGMVGVNNLVIATAEAPFGGIKASGFGREGGSEGVEAYTVAKYINIKL